MRKMRMIRRQMENLWKRRALVWARLTKVIVDAATERFNLNFEDEQMYGLSADLILHIKYGKLFAYRSIYRFDNGHGCLIIRFGGIIDSHHLQPVRFVKGDVFYELDGDKTEYYHDFESLMARVYEIRGLDENWIGSSEYHQRVPEAERMYPMLWVRKKLPI